MTGDALDGEWAERPANPDDSRDLGYDLDDWERIQARDAESERYLYLPEDEELLREEAFVVVDPDDVADLAANR